MNACTSEVRGQVCERLAEVAQWAAKTGVQSAREYCKQNPLRVIGGVAGAAFLLGVALRAKSKNSRD